MVVMWWVACGCGVFVQVRELECGFVVETGMIGLLVGAYE